MRELALPRWQPDYLYTGEVPFPFLADMFERGESAVGCPVRYNPPGVFSAGILRCLLCAPASDWLCELAQTALSADPADEEVRRAVCGEAGAGEGAEDGRGERLPEGV